MADTSPPKPTPSTPMNALPIVSLIATFALGGTAIFMAVQNRSDAQKRQGQIENLEKVVQGTQANAAATAAQLEESEMEKRLLADAVGAKDLQIASMETELQAKTQEAEALGNQFERIQTNRTKPLSPVQRRIAESPAIARVTEYLPDLGFIAIDAGRGKGLESGMEFHIRRDRYLIAKVTIGETVDETTSIANVAGGSIPEGFTIETGDEVIQYLK
ncbi:hypothetical protein OAF27_02070 [Verrucomicrobiales bacterium]|nr:hypothetical protein [Verrucomicrobiales bacterium]